MDALRIIDSILSPIPGGDKLDNLVGG